MRFKDLVKDCLSILENIGDYLRRETHGAYQNAISGVDSF